jgi:hypothetical protein
VIDLPDSVIIIMYRTLHVTSSKHAAVKRYIHVSAILNHIQLQYNYLLIVLATMLLHINKYT